MESLRVTIYSTLVRCHWWVWSAVIDAFRHTLFRVSDVVLSLVRIVTDRLLYFFDSRHPHFENFDSVIRMMSYVNGSYNLTRVPITAIINKINPVKCIEPVFFFLWFTDVNVTEIQGEYKDSYSFHTVGFGSQRIWEASSNVGGNRD